MSPHLILLRMCKCSGYKEYSLLRSQRSSYSNTRNLIDRWFKEVYRNDTLIPEEVNPLDDPRVTISGGQLIINDPNQVQYIVDLMCM